MVETRTNATALVSAAFQAILAGDAPSISDLASTNAISSNDLERLIGRSLMLDADGRVVAAAGLSLVPARQHRLTLRGRQFWKWCAYDAIGIPAGLGEDAVAETTFQQCGTPVKLEFHAGRLLRASNPDARIWDAARMEVSELGRAEWAHLCRDVAATRRTTVSDDPNIGYRRAFHNANQ